MAFMTPMMWISAASTAFSVIGSITQGNDAAANYESQANASRYNAEVSRQQAESAYAESTSKQLAQQRQRRQLLGEQRAGAAQSGVGTGGTTADLLEQTRTLSELDVLNTAYSGAMQARGYNSQAILDDYYAGIYGKNAKTARTAGYFGAAKSLLTGASSIYGARATPAATYGSGNVGSGLRPGGGLGLKF